MGKIIDITGQKFNMLTVLSFSKRENGRSYWMCKCDCGNIVERNSNSFKSNMTKSCGCLAMKACKIVRKTHGLSKSRTYTIWQGMRNRCNDENYKNYNNYGGRGIRVCDRWMESFENFYEDMGNRPNEMSLDRKDVNGNYCKENCKWSTSKEQNNNRRNNHYIEYKGEIKTIQQWADEFNLKYKTLYDRITKMKWTIEKSINHPMKKHKKTKGA